jgi:putative ABC transport system permease protein
MRTQLAWWNLVADWRRLLLACAGIGFAVILMFMQNGFRNAFLDSPVSMVNYLSCDLVALSRARYALASEQQFPAHLLDLARSDADVTEVIPLYIENYRAQVRVIGKRRRPIRVIGVSPRRGVFQNEEIDQQIEGLSAPGTGLLDRHSRHHYGFERSDASQLAAQPIELLDRQLRMIGSFEIGSDFAYEGTIIVSADSFADYFPFRGNGEPLSAVDIALIRTRSPENARQVARRLTELSPREWRVVTKLGLIQDEKRFWETQTPIGAIFGIGTLMGFAVGLIICYQVLYTSINDSMAEFATLKAMGYPNRYFLRLVILQSLYLALLGFIPALLICFGLFYGLELLTGLPMLLDQWRALWVFALTVGMCLISGLVALRKLLHTDPASLF